MAELLAVEPLRFSISAADLSQTDDSLKPRFAPVDERQDACLELRKNFSGQELRYVRNNAREVSRNAYIDGAVEKTRHVCDEV
jgi:hypothetical protein